MNRPARGMGEDVHAKWYETFFEGIALDLWEQAVTPEQTRAEAGFLERELRLGRGARVLDVPCGAGRHAIELASRGHRVAGVDLSEGQIARARKASGHDGPEVEWRRSDMRDLPWRDEFDAAYCLGNSFGYIEPAASRRFLAAVAAALKPGGRFAMDTGLAAESILPRRREREWLRIGEILFLEENRYDVAEGCVETRYTFIRDGVATERTGLQWVHTARELRAMLADAGLQVRGMSGSLEGAPYEVGAPCLYLVAQKG